jgi:hypothetical protein
MPRKTGRRKANEPRLYGSGKAAQVIGVTQTNLRTLEGLPEPYDVKENVGDTSLYRADEIDKFAEEVAERRKARRDALRASEAAAS